MNSLNIRQVKSGTDLIYFLSGTIDEGAQFPGGGNTSSEKVVVDLDNIKLINSVGVRAWMTWTSSFTPKTIFNFRHVVKPMVEQSNMVKGFLPNHYVVESFYVPYYFEEEDDIQYVLYKAGEDFVQGRNGKKGEIKIREVKHTETGEIGEIDVLEEQYFRFIM